MADYADYLAAAGSALNSLGNYKSSRSANKTNMEINKMQIEAAYNMQDRANAFTREQFASENKEWERRWNMENAYNSASSQRQRLEEAGLNPYLMMQGGSAGVASTGGSPSAHAGASGQVPGMIPAQASLMEDTSFKVLDMMKAKADITKANAEAQMAQTDAFYSEQLKQLQIAGILEDNASKRRSNNYGEQTLQADIYKAYRSNDYLDYMVDGAELSNQAVAAGLPYIAPMQAAQLQKFADEHVLSEIEGNLKKSQTAKNYSDVRLNEEQRKEAIARTAKTIEETKNITYTKDQRDRLAEALVDEAEARAQNAMDVHTLNTPDLDFTTGLTIGSRRGDFFPSMWNMGRQALRDFSPFKGFIGR